MLAELSIIPVGEGTHISEQIAIALKFVDASGLPYQLTPSGTCIEGEWDQVMSVIRQCHERVRSISPHVMTLIKIEEDEENPINSPGTLRLCKRRSAARSTPLNREQADHGLTYAYDGVSSGEPFRD